MSSAVIVDSPCTPKTESGRRTIALPMEAADVLKNRVTLQTVIERIGHSRPSTTSDLYAHTLLESQDEATAVMDLLLGQTGILDVASEQIVHKRRRNSCTLCKSFPNSR